MSAVEAAAGDPPNGFSEASIVQKGQKVSVPSETLLEFRLEQSASLPESV
jgi:hypothetical protein